MTEHKQGIVGKAKEAVQSAAESVKALGRETEQSALQKLHTIDAAEIEVGHLAEQRARSKQAREYGHRLVQDHERMDEKVMGLAAGLGLDMQPDAAPTEVKALKHELEDIKKALETAPADEFDKVFAQKMVKAHEEAIALVGKADKDIQGGMLKSLLPETRTRLEEHLKLAKQLESTA